MSIALIDTPVTQLQTAVERSTPDDYDLSKVPWEVVAVGIALIINSNALNVQIREEYVSEPPPDDDDEPHWIDRHYISYQKDEEEWRLGSNFEDAHSTMIFKPSSNTWYYREPVNGTDKLLGGGLAGAMSNANIFFTG